MDGNTEFRIGFVPSVHFRPSSSTSTFLNRCRFFRKHGRTTDHPKRSRIAVSGTRCSTETTPSRERVLKYGIDAAVEDFIKSGLNICIGGGKKEEVETLVDALDSLNQVEGLIDVAFVSASPATTALLEKRGMPSDLSVNFKKGLDLFVAIVHGVDADCNAVIDSDNIAGDKYAAQVADKVVLIVHEEDLEQSENGLRTVPIQLVNFLPDQATESLCSGLLVELGVRGASLRNDGSGIADLELAPYVHPLTLENELCSMAQVAKSGILLATEKTIAVVATRDCQPIDMTSALSLMTSRTDVSSVAFLTDEKRQGILGKYSSDWLAVPDGGGEMLSRKFKFLNVNSAEAFIRYVHYVSRVTCYCPEISHCGTEVEVIVRTVQHAGITELDTLIAKELASVYQRMFSRSQMIF